MIDICDFAVGLSRQLYGLTIASERPSHRMMETWHPLGVDRHHFRLQFPRRGLGLECRARACLRQFLRLEAVGEDAADALACQALFERQWRASGRCRHRQPCVGRDPWRPRAGEALADRSPRAAGLGDGLDRDGPRVAPAVAQRFGRAISNSAATMPPSSARPRTSNSTLRAVAFSAPGNGRPALHDAEPAVRSRQPSMDRLWAASAGAYASVRIGDPLARTRPWSGR